MVGVGLNQARQLGHGVLEGLGALDPLVRLLFQLEIALLPGQLDLRLERRDQVLERALGLVLLLHLGREVLELVLHPGENKERKENARDKVKETTLERADFTLQLLMFVTAEKRRGECL